MRRVGLKSNLKSDLSGRKRDCAMGQAEHSGGLSPRRTAGGSVRRDRRSLRPDARNSEHPFVPTETKCVLITVASQ